MKKFATLFVSVFVGVALGYAIAPEGFYDAIQRIRQADRDVTNVIYQLRRHDRDPDVRRAIQSLENARREFDDAQRYLEYAREVIVVTAEGKGGTSHNDRTAACAKAQERALEDAEALCRNQRGRVVSQRLEFVVYERYSEGHICRYRAHVDCEI